MYQNYILQHYEILSINKVRMVLIYGLICSRNNRSDQTIYILINTFNRIITKFVIQTHLMVVAGNVLYP